VWGGMAEAASPARVYCVVLQVYQDIWPKWREAQKQGGQVQGPPSKREVADYVEALGPIVELLQPSSPTMQGIGRTIRLMTTELWLFKRILYKHKNQHAHAHYWRHIIHMKKLITNLIALQLSLLPERLPFSLQDPAPGSTLNAHQWNVLPERPTLASVLYWVLALASLVRETMNVIKECAVDMLTLIEQTFFMAFALTVLSISSRFHSLCKFIGTHLDSLYGMLYRALDFCPNQRASTAANPTSGVAPHVVLALFVNLLGPLPRLLEARLNGSEKASRVLRQADIGKAETPQCLAASPVPIPSVAVTKPPSTPPPPSSTPATTAGKKRKPTTVKSQLPMSFKYHEVDESPKRKRIRGNTIQTSTPPPPTNKARKSEKKVQPSVDDIFSSLLPASKKREKK